MAAAPPERLRLLLLLPARRHWPWHARLQAALAERHDVITAHVASAAYPLSLRLALGLKAARPQPVPAGEFDLVLDLSEQGIGTGTRVLRPLYDGSPDSLFLVGRLQRGECPLLDIAEAASGAIRASSYPAIGDSGRLDGRLALVFVRLEALLLRAVAGEGAPLADRPERPRAGFSAGRLVKALARRLAARMLAPVRPAPRTIRHWNVAVRRDDAAPDIRRFDLADYTPLPVNPEVFGADPFLFAHDGKTYLFVETFPYATGKGVIMGAELDAGGIPVRWFHVLERPWHLSYPYVFAHGGEIWLAPEGSAHGGVELYRAIDFPGGWRLDWHLLPDWRLVDPTFIEHEGRLWLFAGAAAPGGSDWDELYAWHAPSLEGPWTPHALNPIKSDCRSARPGGRPLRLGEQLLRPAQCCERFYGEALAWLEIRRLTPDAFEEVAVASWRAAGEGMSGPHSADLSGSIRAVDYRFPLATG
jgi:hypothetical protein